MNEQQRGALIGGIILILVGLGFLASQFIPDLFGGWFQWPMIMIGIGVLFLIGALVGREGGLAIPGCVVGGLGLIFYYQNSTGDWASWAYVWALIPGFVGLGIILGSLIDSNLNEKRRDGLVLLGISAVSFVVFAGLFRTGWDAWRYWPVILIVVGAILAARAFMGRK
ncbi:MAG: hypothetical protein J5I90_17465 [Caldilineales bacterium]|nr:hypothetical protein [Caldilineales bacterium]